MQKEDESFPHAAARPAVVPQLTLTDDASPETSHSGDSSDIASDGDDGDAQEVPMTAAERLAEKRRMKRFRLTHSQTRFLMGEFAQQPHPDSSRRERLSQDIPGLSPRQVQVWFQNRRAKMKRSTHDDRGRIARSRASSTGFGSSRKQQRGLSLSSLARFNGPGTSLVTRASSTRHSSLSKEAEHMSSSDTSFLYQTSPVSLHHEAGATSISSLSPALDGAFYSAQGSPLFPSLCTSPQSQSAGYCSEFDPVDSTAAYHDYTRARANSLMTLSPTASLPGGQFDTYSGRQSSDDLMHPTYHSEQYDGSTTGLRLPYSQTRYRGSSFTLDPSSYGSTLSPESYTGPGLRPQYARPATAIPHATGSSGWLSPQYVPQQSLPILPGHVDHQRGLQPYPVDVAMAAVPSEGLWNPTFLEAQQQQWQTPSSSITAPFDEGFQPSSYTAPSTHEGAV